MKRIPRFISNSETNIDCFPACIAMIKNYFEESSYTVQDMVRYTDKRPEKWAWPIHTYVALKKDGYSVVVIENFDYHSFSHAPGSYLYEIFGEEVAMKQIKYSDIEYEAKKASELVLSDVEIFKRIPTIDDIFEYLDQGYLIGCGLNSCTLNGKEGYSGHFILVFDYDDQGFIVHDPGLPPKPHTHVDYNIFTKAWTYPNEQARNILAVKRYTKP